MRSTSDWPVAFSCSWNRKRQSGNRGVCQARQQGDHVIGDLGSPFGSAHQTKLSPTRLPPATIDDVFKEHACAVPTGETLFGRGAPRYSTGPGYLYSTTSLRTPHPQLTEQPCRGALLEYTNNVKSSSRCRGAPHEDRLSIVDRSTVEIRHRGATSKLWWQLLGRPVFSLSHEIQKSRNLATIAKTRCRCVATILNSRPTQHFYFRSFLLRRPHRADARALSKRQDLRKLSRGDTPLHSAVWGWPELV